MLALALAAALTACPQTPPANPEPQIVNASLVRLAGGSSTPIASNASSGVKFEFNTPMNRSSVEQAINLYPGVYDPNVASSTLPNLQLSAVCDGTWRVTNPNPRPSSFTWSVNQSTEQSVGVVAGNSQLSFSASKGSKTLNLLVKDRLQASLASSATPCTSSLNGFNWASDSRSVTVSTSTPIAINQPVLATVSNFAKAASGNKVLPAPYSASLAGRSREVRRMRNGETWVTSFGVVVEAPLGAFLGTDPTLEFYVEKVNDPQPYLKYPVGNTPLVGSMYRIGSTEGDFELRKGAVPLKIWLPVPAGETLGGLFIQRLWSSIYLNDFYGAEYFWNAGGPYTVVDVVNQRIGVKETFVFADGGPYGLFRNTPNLNLISETPNVTPRSTNNFTAYCGKATDSVTIGPNSPTGCNTAMRQKFENLSQVYYDFLVQSMGLTGTELPKISGILFLYKPGESGTPCANIFYAAFYQSNGDILYCLATDTDSTGIFPANYPLKAAKHEIFHGVQHGIIDISTIRNKKGALLEFNSKFRDLWDWIDEGTARASEQSGTTMVITAQKNKNQRKLIDYFVNPYIPGTPNLNNYATQDFWVYSGQKASLGLIYLKEVFRQININLQDAVASKNIDLLNPVKGIEKAYQLEPKLSKYGGFAGMYWLWAKNQGYEKSVKIRTDPVPDPDYLSPYKPWSEFCTPEILDTSNSGTSFSTLPKTLTRSPIDPDYNNPGIYSDVNNKDLGIPIATDKIFKQSVQIQPLQTRVVRIRFAGLPRDLNVKKMFKISVKPDSSDTKLKYKVYSNTIPAVSNSSCLTPEPNVTIPDPKPSPSPEDGDQIVSNISALSEVLVFVANVDLDSANSTNPAAKSATVTIEPVTPKIQVTPQILNIGSVVGGSATGTIQISNIGNLNSTLEVKSYRVSAAAVVPPTSSPPLFPNEPAFLSTFTNPSNSVQRDLKITQSNLTPMLSSFVEFRCTTVGIFSGNISIASKSASTRSNGSAIVDVLNVPVTVTCKVRDGSSGGGLGINLPCWAGNPITYYGNSFFLKMRQDAIIFLEFSTGFTVVATKGEIFYGLPDATGGLMVRYDAPPPPDPPLPEGEPDFVYLTYTRNGFSKVLQLQLINFNNYNGYPLGQMFCTNGFFKIL
jgi:hypothetical protein